MNRTNRRVAVLIITSCLALAACGRNSEAPPEQQDEEESAAVEIDLGKLAPPIEVVTPPPSDTRSEGSIVVNVQPLAAADPPGPSIDLTRRAQTAGDDAASEGCDEPHYLLGELFDGRRGYNRFDWWKRTPPPTGPIRTDFRCEFSTALATVVGGEPPSFENPTPDSLGFLMGIWNPWLGGSPNGVRGTGFSIRSHRPASNPVVRMKTIQGGRSVAVLINEPVADHTIAPGPGLRPSLWLDFDTPRRAVGLEYGYEPLPGINTGTIDASGAKLLAYDRDGNFITGASGKGCLVDQDGSLPEGNCFPTGIEGSNLDSTVVTQPIGVRDRRGRISSVELRFDFADADGADGPGAKILDQQAVYRIWHEPLPPAAVLQDFAGVEVRSAPQPNTIPLAPDFETTFRRSVGPRAPVKVPYRFDRVVALLRGFRFEFLDQSVHDVGDMRVGIEQDRFEFDPDAERETVTITPVGILSGSANTSPSFRAVAYYSIVGWDSEQTSVDVAFGSTGFVDFPQRAFDVITSGSAQQNSVLRLDSFGGDRLFGAMQKLRIGFSQPGVIDELGLVFGAQRTIAHALRDSDSLRTDFTRTLWGMSSLFEGPGGRLHSMQVDGGVLAGRHNSLRLGADSAGLTPYEQQVTKNARVQGWLPLAVPSSGPRAPGEFAWTADINRNNILWAWPVMADVAVVGLQLLHVEPGDRLRQLDVELRGEFYDGRLIDWQAGFGIDVNPPIGSGGETKRSIMALPMFAAINRNTFFATSAATRNELFLRDALVGCSNRYAGELGYVESTGAAPLAIKNVAKATSPDDAYFDYEFRLQREWMSLNELKNRLPVIVWPGRRLDIRATYTPDEMAGTIEPLNQPHLGQLVFETDSPTQSTITYRTNGFTRTGTAAAEWATPSLDFSLLQPGRSKRMSALLHSTGSMPLCINAMRIENTPSPFTVVGLRGTPEPEIAAIDVTATCPQPAALGCSGTNHLIVETNAGTLRLPLSVNNLSPGD